MSTEDFKDQILPLSDRIYPMAARMLNSQENAEDAVQEIMLKLWDRRKQIGQHPNIPAFVFLTARNHCLDLLKKSNPDFETSDKPFMRLADASEQNSLEWSELTAIIKQILQELPEQQREVMLMRDIDGYEFSEIAAATALKVEHVRVLLSRARKQVGVKLKEIYSYE